MLASLIVLLAIRMTFASAVMPILYAGTIPMTLAIVARLLMQGHPFYLAMAAMAIGLHVYFIFLAKGLNATALAMLEFRAEKDALIAEIEEEKAISDEARRRAEVGQHRQVALPGHHEPRAAHAAQCHPRVLGGDEVRAARSDAERRTTRSMPATSTTAAATCCSSSTRSWTCPASRPAATSCTRSRCASPISSRTACACCTCARRAKDCMLSLEFEKGLRAALGRRARHPPDLPQPDVERAEVHAARRHASRSPLGSTPDGGQTLVRQGHRARHSQGGDPQGHAGVRPGLAGAPDRRRRHRPRPAHRAEPGRLCTAARSSSARSCARAPKPSSSCRQSRVLRPMPPLQPLGQERHRQPAGRRHAAAASLVAAAGDRSRAGNPQSAT